MRAGRGGGCAAPVRGRCPRAVQCAFDVGFRSRRRGMGMRRRAAGRDGGGGRNARLRLQRGGHSRARASFPGRLRAVAARRALRAQGQLQPRGGRGRPDRRRPRGRQLGGRDRGGPAGRLRPRGHRLHGRGQDAGGDRPGGRAGRQGDQRRIGGRAGADIVGGAAARHDGPRRPPRQPGHRRRQPSPHLDRTEPAQVRGRDRRRSGDRARCLGPRGAALHRAPHPRRLPDARAGAAAAGGGLGGRPGAGAGRRRREAGAPRPWRRSGHRLRRGGRGRRRSTPTRRPSSRRRGRRD